MATLLLAEIANGHLGDITARALTAALQLGAPVDVLVSGRNVAEAAAAAAKLAGVAKVRVADDPLYEHGLAEPLAALLVALAPEYDAILAASSPFSKNVLPRAAALLDVDEFLPAVGQGAIGIETRADDTATRALVAKIDDADTATAVTAERAFLAVLDGSCRTPIGGHARISNGAIYFHGIIVKPDGSAAFEVLREGRRTQAAELGADAGRELKARGGGDFFVRD